MNEQFKELAEQCHHQYSEHNIDLDKFAQLIVLQCIDLCLDRHHTWRWDDEPDSSSGPRDCAESIKTYFGVK